jgi:hypothetical protein
VRNGTAAGLVDNDRARSSEHECKRSDKFCTALFHKNNRQAPLRVPFLFSTQQQQKDMNFSVLPQRQLLLIYDESIRPDAR